MQILKDNLMHWLRTGVYLGSIAGFLLVGAGCASTSKTTKTKTVVTHPDQTTVYDNGRDTTTIVAASPNQAETETTTETTQITPSHPGIISSTVHAVGWVIALPFRLVGALFTWIF